MIGLCAILNRRWSIRVTGQILTIRRGWLPCIWGYQRRSVDLGSMLQVSTGPEPGGSDDESPRIPERFKNQWCSLLIQNRSDHYFRTVFTLRRRDWLPIANALRQSFGDNHAPEIFSTFPNSGTHKHEKDSPWGGFKSEPSKGMDNLYAQEELRRKWLLRIYMLVTVVAIVIHVLSGGTLTE